MAKKLKEWFDRDCALRIGAAIEPNYDNFDTEKYADEVDEGVNGLELKDRVYLMAKALRDQLPDDYSKAGEVLEYSLGSPLETEEGMFIKGYWLMPIARLVEEFGLENFDISMRLNEKITMRHTSEYSVRPYIERDTAKALQYMNNWAQSQNVHVRRLAVEGGRPRLPWAKQLNTFINNPEPMLKLIEPLKEDTSKYVRKSIANLINDVSKDHPDRIRQLAEDWKNVDSSSTCWILKHGMRTLNR
ncbi:DNA alkylation repair protein [Lentilitoribacter sp. EG35]|uniref:DNA alkylation repair protein n=1 Tax=Lentilitoribacter sp. EG35 TaxID=3234192 RepID=UPI0034606430